MRISTLLLLLSLVFMNLSQGQVSRLSSNYHSPYQDSYQRVATGYNHYLEIKNGKLYASGSNSNGQLGIDSESVSSVSQLIQVGTDENWVTITAGDSFSLGIKADGTLWGWGKNDKGQLGIGTNVVTETPTQVGADKWFSVSAGASFVLGIKSDGTLWAWGDNMMGQLGNGSNNYSANPNPIQIGTNNNWWKISAGFWHGLALKADGTLWAWGGNATGQVGNGSTSFMGEATPAQIGTDKWREISAGGFFSTGIKSNGTLWAWGDNYYGQIANGNTTSQLAPTQIGSDNKWKALAAGRNHSVALKTDGTVWSWADETGQGTEQAGVVTQKTELTGIVQISSGDSFSFALKSNGELYSWGKNNEGQLGQGNTIDNITPTFNNSVSNEIITVASAHWFTTYTLYSNGALKGWGANSDFELGVDTNGDDQYSPIAIPTAQNNNIAIIPGIEHALVLKDDGTLWGWGASDVVGTGTIGLLETATQVGSSNDWLVVTAGSFASAGIKTDGTLWTWGSNYDGELGLGDEEHRDVPTQVGTETTWKNIAIGASHSIAVKTDGTLWGWGRNYAAEAVGGENEDNILSPQQIGTDNDWVYVSGGSMTSYAIKSNGTLWGWGASSMGQIGLELPLPTKVTTPTQIGTDSFIQARVANWSGAGITTDGTVMAWGNMNFVFFELGMGDGTNYPTPTVVPNQTNVVGITAGQAHKTILKSLREDVCVVGRNYSGELGIGNESITTLNTYQCGIAPVENQQTVVIENIVVSVQQGLAPEITIQEGTLQLVATVNPTGANQDVIWSVIEGGEFASVNENGLVTAIENGTVTVRATSVEDETKFDEIEIVIDYEEIVLVETVNVSVQDNLAPEITTEEGTLQLVAVVNPTEANQDVIWSVIEGGEFALVDENGLVTAIENGTVTIRATSVEDETKFDEIEIVIDYEEIVLVETVNVSVQDNLAPEITTHEGTLQLVAIVNPTEANQDVIWSVIEGEEFATIDENGLVTAITNGTVTIRATSVEDETKFDEIEVVINITLSVKDVEGLVFKIYPNPTHDFIYLESSEEIKEISVVTITGQQILSTKNSQLDLSSLTTGVYILKVELSNNVMFTEKIIRN